MQVDFLIIGQGLAGSLLAWELIQQQYRIMVLDNGAENASQVAAGLINPLSGRRLVKTPEIEKLLPAATDCYEQLNQMFAQRFFVEMPMLRILQNQTEQDYAKKRSQQSEYQSYLSTTNPPIRELRCLYGVLPQTQTGFLQTRPLLQQLRSFFIKQACYRRVQLNYQQITFAPVLQWQDIQPRHIVFCEGYQAIDNPWFAKLPFQLAKGEILDCELDLACPKQILNYGKWLIPLGDRRFKTGATFDTKQIDILPTESARTGLLTALNAVFSKPVPADVTAHRAGIRPATLDKNPFIGAHPQYKQLHIFNGFGSKGGLSIPWYCRQFIQALEKRAALEVHSDIARYYDTHFPD